MAARMIRQAGRWFLSLGESEFAFAVFKRHYSNLSTAQRRSGAANWAATEKFGISVARLQRDWINRAKSAPTQSLSKIAQSGVELNFET